MHGFGVVINGRAKIGRNCIMYQGVTVGTIDMKTFPTIAGLAQYSKPVKLILLMVTKPSVLLVLGTAPLVATSVVVLLNKKFSSVSKTKYLKSSSLSLILLASPAL